MRSKGEWSEVEIPLSRFLLTWKGRVVEEVRRAGSVHGEAAAKQQAAAAVAATAATTRVPLQRLGAA